MDPKTLEIISSTVPVLQAHGEALTALFYAQLLEHNPELRAFFNIAHQGKGTQQRALASAVLSYAVHIHKLEALGPAVELIAHKHTSLGIAPEHYPIVGKHLISALAELLGEGATPEILDAWTKAYNVLAQIMINREADLYGTHQSEHGWTGFRDFEVFKKVEESEEITSFYLKPATGQLCAPHKPGQYITVRIPSNETGTTMRQYSLSCSPQKDFYRISVKREGGGVVSNWLHHHLKQGGHVEVGPPCGEFVLDTSNALPIVLIAGGVGITPLLSMLHAIKKESAQEIHLIQAVQHGGVHAFADELEELTTHLPALHIHTCYEYPSEQDKTLGRFDTHGRVNLDLLERMLPTGDKQIYLCGPGAFMSAVHDMLTTLGADPSHIRYESFGPLESHD